MVNSIDAVDPTSATQQSSGVQKMKQMREDVLSAVASKMGESEDDLKTQMASGKSLSDIASAKGISTDDLKSTIDQVVKKDMPNASASQIDNVTNRMVQGHGGHHHHHHVQAASSTSTTDPTQASADGSISIQA